MKPFGSWGPVRWATMGSEGTGKTRDLINTWRSKGAYYGHEISLGKVIAGMGFTDEEQDRLTKRVKRVNSLTTVSTLLRKYAGTYGKVPPLEQPVLGHCVDDATRLLLADRARVWADIPEQGRGAFQRWEKLEELVLEVVSVGTTTGVNLFLNFHIRDEKNVVDPDLLKKANKIEVKFNPRIIGMPGMSMARSFSKDVDVIAEVAPDSAQWPWPVSIQGQPPSDEVIIKDRHGYLLGPRPFCTREILRHLGYAVGPAPSWEEDATAQIAELLADKPLDDLARAAKEPALALAANYGQERALLILHNAAARAIIPRTTFFSSLFE